MKKATTIRMPQDLKDKLKKRAYERGMTLNSLIMMIFDEWLKSKNS